MALTPGGGRSASTQPRPSSTREAPPRPPRSPRKPLWPRSASVSVLRLGLLIGGLVIIVDLAITAATQRSFNPDDATSLDFVDQILNYVLFSLLGVLVVRNTGIMFSGVVAGVFASLLDAIVVTAAAVMVAPQPPPDELELRFGLNLLIGTVFAGLSGLVYALVQRWSGGQRAR